MEFLVQNCRNITVKRQESLKHTCHHYYLWFFSTTRTREIITHQLVLIGGHRCKNRLREDECLVLFVLEVYDLSWCTFGSLHEMYSWLVFVHRVQN